jgi:hypothetical protein
MVMNDLETMEERRVLRWGGLAGILGSIVMIVVFAIVAVFVGPDVLGEGLIDRFPDIRAARTVENGLWLAVLVLWMVHFLALYHALRATHLAAALFGSVLGVVGLTILAANALPHVWQLPISDLYHAPGATPEDQAMLVAIWSATEGIGQSLLGAGLLILPAALIALGAAMLDAPAFGKGYGWLTLGLGAIVLVSAVVFLILPPSPVATVGVLALFVFHLVVGWKVVILSRTP